MKLDACSLVALITLATLTRTAIAADAPLLRQDDRIVFVGDSITGQGWKNGQGRMALT